MPPVCSNCGAAEFVWANDLKTGSMGRGGLALRRGGELSLGTRICRNCGHADLFVKDPAFLRQPHTWRPGEFVPITPKPEAAVAPPTPSVPSRPSPTPTPTPEPLTPLPVAPAPSQPEPVAPMAEPMPDATSAGTSSTSSDTAPKKATKRRSAKAKATDSPPSE